VSTGTFDRREVAAILLRDPGDLLVVTGLGSTTYDAGAAGDRPENFYLWGAMGGAVMVGLGLALAQPRRRVVVLTGDGEMLMGMGSLATAAVQRPGNLSVAVFDNGRYGETGSQSSHTALGVDLAGIAAACGWKETSIASTLDEVEAIRLRLREHALFAVIRISDREAPRYLPPRDGAYLVQRFRRAIGVSELSAGT
jgi:thiamine pyrophosphate-dependent acetolactate synthase large subunit-like protein